ncbi:hypothetical protein [Fuscibacter oryzae]|uniref:VPLPA-CTERM sorting domain-containing protein n=1 Tax=Fuscibacter oryzae TaxID=2803939 RepID=A0A8J7MSZ9_9RHOB|nr:hypothetical protein [Fuscibacter oryzae]MBL4930072.1 hypothetical protein [Fuscibacter oryzae]
MTFLKSLVLAAALLAPAASNAAPIYADSVVSYNKGLFKKTLAGRDYPTAALGAEDGLFVSLGIGGSIVLSFAQPFRAVGKIFEVTFNDPKKQPEFADVYVGDGTTWTLIASLKNYLATTFAAKGVFTQIKIVDTTPKKGKSFDGFDIDAVSVSPVPVPAAGLLLGGALLGLGSLRRRGKRA